MLTEEQRKTVKDVIGIFTYNIALMLT